MENRSIARRIQSLAKHLMAQQPSVGTGVIALALTIAAHALGMVVLLSGYK